MSMMLRLAVFPVVIAVSACSASLPVKPADELEQTDRAVSSALDKGEVVEQSLLRDGNKVSLSVQSDEGLFYLQASCAAGSAAWVYADLAADKPSHATGVRRYGSGTATYSPPLALSERTADLIRQLPKVQQACEREPAWREVVYNKRSDTQILLDVTSVQDRGDGSLHFWAAIDYPYLAYIRLFKAPYARRAGFYHVDCLRQSYSLLYVHYLDQQQTVTDGGLAARPPAVNFGQAPSDFSTLLTTVCGKKELLETLVPPETRDKQFPDFAALPALDANVVNQIAKLHFAQPKQPLSYIRVEGTKTFKSGSAAARLNSKSGSFLQEASIKGTETPGVFHIVQFESGDKTEQMSFLGMIPIGQSFNSTDIQNVSIVDRLELRGDWNKMPVNGQLSYRQRTRVADIVTNLSSKEVEVICKIIRNVSADGLNPQLQGNAKELKCHIVGDRDDELSTYYYLEDYGFAFQQGVSSTKYSQNSRLTEFR
ncbi:MAG: hypothetical protein LBF61_01395 [Azoarcus sp.]|jgi:hypothetical protein|nr:hypothetical protein [Azoarcus sp.]